MTFEFSVADQRDDAQIRSLLARNPMPGRISVAFEREPDYFAGHGIMGDRTLTLKAVDAQTGDLAGILCVAQSDRFIDGQIRSVGYLGQIRVDSQYRGYLLPMRSIAYLRSIANDWPDLWFCAIVDNNPVARAIFAERSRPSFPRLVPVSDIHTFGLLARPGHRTRRNPFATPGSGIEVKPASEVGIDAVVEFMHENAASRQFFPCYRAVDLEPDRSPHSSPRLPGLAASDVLVVARGDEIVGVGGVWDQSGTKQTVVHGYAGWLRALRPIVNGTRWLTGVQRLPATGEKLRSAYLSMLMIRDDDAEILRILIEAALGLADQTGMDYLLVGMSIRDPLLAAVRAYRHILYQSTMYAFSFGHDRPDELFDPDRIPYLEIAAL